MIYLDNAATTNKKPLSTYIGILKALTYYNSNPSRGSHKLSIRTGIKVEECRDNIKKLVNAPDNAEVVYTYNCTEAINYAIQGSLQPHDHVIITTFEHNAVLRTLANKNIDYSVAVPTDKIITINDIKKLRKPNTKMIIVNHTSNVTGTTTPLNEIGKYCKSNNILFLVDGAQSLGHIKVDMKKDNINFISVAGHKGLYGTQGIGALVINNAQPQPIKYGGSGTESEKTNMPEYYPERLEAGTINTVGILALDGGIRYVNKHFTFINTKITKLSNMLLNYLNKNKKYIVYSNNPNSGVISFNIKNMDTNDVINYLNDHNICVRGGLHCAPLAHKYLGTINSGTVRVSISHYNSIHDIKRLIKVLEKLTSNNQ